MEIDVLTLFPDMFPGVLDESILKRARNKGLIKIKIRNLRDYTYDNHRTADDKPFGGGAGMVMRAEPILKAVSALRKFKNPASSASWRISAGRQKSKCKIIVLSAKGKQFNQKLAYDWSKKHDQLILISGRYEGIDERVKLALKAEEVSIGPYVLTDGEVASMVVISAVSRLIPGVIRLESLAEESHWNLLLKKEKDASRGTGLEYPHYTRPEMLVYKGKKLRVPGVLISGDHKKISAWRRSHRK